MKKFLRGFVFAFEGILYALKTQINMRFHFAASLVVIGLGFYFQLSTGEWLFISLAIASVWTTELFNTALEALTDLTTKDIHPLAKVAKDCAAGAVLISALFAVSVGVIVFWSYIF